MQGEHEHDALPPVPIVQPVLETANDELVAPVIDHAEKITRIEERQAQHQVELARQLVELEERLRTASGSQIDSLMQRIAGLEDKIAASAEENVGVPDESIELELPEVEASPAPPEKIKQGLRHRRKAKKKGKS